MKIIFSIIFYLIGFYALFLDNAARLNLGLIYYFWTFYFLKINIFEETKGQKLIFLIILVMLYFIPSIGLFYFYALDVIHIIFLTIVFFELLNKFSDNLIYLNSYQKNDKTNLKIRYITYIFLISWSITGPFLLGQSNTIAGILSHMVPSALSLIFLESILRSSKSLSNAILILFFHFIFVFIYLNNHWVGMGRIFLGFYLLAPIMIFLNVFNISIKNFLIIIAAPVALFILQYSRYMSTMDLESAAIGSAGYHLFLTDLIFVNEYDIGKNAIDAWLDELKLFFLIWFPRELWVTKPIGISMWSVDIMFDRSSFINGDIYSHSVGFIGEQKLILGDNYIFGLVLILIILIFLRKLIVYFSFGSNVPAIIFDLNLMSYFWGGMALFGSRLWFVLLPVILFCLIRNMFLSSYKIKDENKIKLNYKD